jgi:hypothetical protein
MRPITPDVCTIELDVSEAPDAYLRPAISLTRWKASIKYLFRVAQINVLRA